MNISASNRLSTLKDIQGTQSVRSTRAFSGMQPVSLTHAKAAAKLADHVLSDLTLALISTSHEEFTALKDQSNLGDKHTLIYGAHKNVEAAASHISSLKSADDGTSISTNLNAISDKSTLVTEARRQMTEPANTTYERLKTIESQLTSGSAVSREEVKALYNTLKAHLLEMQLRDKSVTGLKKATDEPFTAAKVGISGAAYDVYTHNQDAATQLLGAEGMVGKSQHELYFEGNMKWLESKFDDLKLSEQAPISIANSQGKFVVNGAPLLETARPNPIELIQPPGMQVVSELRDSISTLVIPHRNGSPNPQNVQSTNGQLVVFGPKPISSDESVSSQLIEQSPSAMSYLSNAPLTLDERSKLLKLSEHVIRHFKGDAVITTRSNGITACLTQNGQSNKVRLDSAQVRRILAWAEQNKLQDPIAHVQKLLAPSTRLLITNGSGEPAAGDRKKEPQKTPLLIRSLSAGGPQGTLRGGRNGLLRVRTDVHPLDDILTGPLNPEHLATFFKENTQDKPVNVKKAPLPSESQSTKGKRPASAPGNFKSVQGAPRRNSFNPAYFFDFKGQSVGAVNEIEMRDLRNQDGD